MKVHKVISANSYTKPTRAQVVILVEDKFIGNNGQKIVTHKSVTRHIQLNGDAWQGVSVRYKGTKEKESPLQTYEFTNQQLLDAI